jgi:hypothetical protein
LLASLLDFKVERTGLLENLRLHGKGFAGGDGSKSVWLEGAPREPRFSRPTVLRTFSKVPRLKAS